MRKKIVFPMLIAAAIALIAGKEATTGLLVKVDLSGDVVVFDLQNDQSILDHTIELQRSSNGLNFKTFSKVKYKADLILMDSLPQTGFNYYRLVEANGNNDPKVLSQVSLIYVPGNFDDQCVIKGESPEGEPFEYTFTLPDSCGHDTTAILVPVYDIYGNRIDVPVKVDPSNQSNQLYINLDNNLAPSIFTVRRK